MHSLPLIGLSGEYQRLTSTLRRRKSLLILGAAGSGKSMLIAVVVRDSPRSCGIIQLQYTSSLHHLLIDLCRALFRREHTEFIKLARAGRDTESWLARQSSVHLRGILWTSLETEPVTIVLDGVAGASFPMYRFFQRLYFTKGMTLIASARDPVSLGTLARLFWDTRNTIHLHPLNEVDASQLFDVAVDRFQLGHLDIQEFRGKVLDAAQGNPGQIIEMCRFASNPMYLSGTHIKFGPLRIDVATKFL
jgi:hypothetical protein